MELIDVTPGLAPTLLWSSRLPAVIRAISLVAATGFTAGVAFIALHVTRQRDRTRS
jgi:hypothetical protein